MSNPRLLFVGNYLHSGSGRPQVSYEIAARLRGLQWPVQAVSPFRSRLLRLLHMATTVWRQRRRLDAVAIDVFSTAAFRIAEICSRLAAGRCPVVLALHGGNLPDLATRSPERVRRLLARADAIVAPSGWLKDQLEPLADRPIRVIPNPLDIARYPHRQRSPVAPHMLWLRAFHEIYRPEVAVRALHVLAATHPDARLTMIGPDKQDGSCQRTRQLAAALGVEARLDIRGPIPREEVPSAIDAHGGVFINTTAVDNMPVSVMEAMAGELPIATTDVGGVPHLAPHNERALLVPPDDPAALAAAVAQLVDNAGLAARLSLAGRRFAETLDWSVVLPQWQELFRSLASAPRRSRP